MEHGAHLFLLFLILVLVVIYLKLNYLEIKIEHPEARFCSNGVVFDNEVEKRMINYTDRYIENYVGNEYFKTHFNFVDYKFSDCNVVVHYNYTVGNVSKIIFIKLVIPNQKTFIVKNNNVPHHPFEIKYYPGDFRINYTSYKVEYDPEMGFSYVFYYNNVPIGEGNAQTGELQRTFNTF